MVLLLLLLLREEGEGICRGWSLPIPLRLRRRLRLRPATRKNLPSRYLLLLTKTIPTILLTETEQEEEMQLAPIEPKSSASTAQEKVPWSLRPLQRISPGEEVE